MTFREGSLVGELVYGAYIGGLGRAHGGICCSGACAAVRPPQPEAIVEVDRQRKEHGYSKKRCSKDALSVCGYCPWLLSALRDLVAAEPSTGGLSNP